MNSWHHAQSAARKWGGTPEDYLPIEEFIDSSKQIIGDTGMPIKPWMSGAQRTEVPLSTLLGGSE